MKKIHHQPNNGRWLDLPKDFVLPGGTTLEQVWLLVFDESSDFLAMLESNFIERLLRSGYSVENVSIGWKSIVVVQKRSTVLNGADWEAFYKLLNCRE